MARKWPKIVAKTCFVQPMTPAVGYISTNPLVEVQVHDDADWITPNQARRLAKALLDAADEAEGEEKK